MAASDLPDREVARPDAGAPVLSLHHALAVGSTLVARGVSSILNLVLNILIGRVLGAAGSGAFFLFISWTNLLGTIGNVGLQTHAMRVVAALDHAGDRRGMRGAIRAALRLNMQVSVAVVATVLLFSRPLAAVLLGSVDYVSVLQLAACGGGLLGLVRILADTLKARGRPNLGLTIEFAIAPSVLVVALLASLTTRHAVRLMPVLATYLLALIVSAAIAYAPAVRALPTTAPRGERPSFRTLLAFWGVALVNNGFAAAPYIMLPHFATTAQIGQFGVAHRLVALSATILAALASIWAPAFAKDYAAGDHARLMMDFRSAQVYSLAAYLPFLLVFTLLPDLMLAAFGREFAAAGNVLIVLALARVVNSVLGLTEQVLNMAGLEKAELWSALASLGVFFGTSVLVGPRWGAMGITWAFAIAFALRSVISFIIVERTIGVRVRREAARR